VGSSQRLRILVLGYIVRGPLGGLAWHHLQYVLGLSRLGHDVYFLEDSEDYDACYDPTQDRLTKDPSYGLAFAADAFTRLRLEDRWAYYDAHTNAWLGPAARKVGELCSAADVLLNVSGVNPLRPWVEQVPTRVLIDTDPAFTQIRHLTDPKSHALAVKHNRFFTFAENIRRAECTIPDDGLAWSATRQPVVMDAWPETPGPEKGPLTTVMQWDSYPALEYEGRSFGMKSESFGPFLDLPSELPECFELALGSADAPRSLLEKMGWGLLDPRIPTRDPWTYQEYIQGSKGEFSVAKEAYVSSRSGWFSERTCAYLASGRPAIVQDTGFSDWLPTGLGLMRFSDKAEAVAGIEKINQDYRRHCRAARELVGDYFEAGRVLLELLARAGSASQGTVEKTHRAAPVGESGGERPSSSRLSSSLQGN
jgi:hypothetical protein